MRGIRRALVFTSALCLLPTVVRAQDPYADFRVPEHRSFSWRVNSNGNANWDQQDTQGGMLRQRFGNGQLSSLLRWSTESEARQRDLSVAADGFLSQSRSSATSTFAGSETELQHGRNDAQRITIQANQRSYLGASAFAVELQAISSLVFRETASSRTTHDLNGTIEQFTGSESQTHIYSHAGGATVGFGRGRVRDVTGVFSAQLIEQRLRATGRLSRALSPETRLRLAQLHYIAGDFSAAHDRPSRYFWREAERILREDGALSGGTLDAYPLLRVLESPLGGLSFPRTTGCFVSPFWFGSDTRGHADFISTFSATTIDNGTPIASFLSESSDRTILDHRTSGAGLSAEVHRPVGMRWQADALASITYGIAPERAWNASAGVDVNYMIADRWFVSGQLLHQVFSERLEGVRTEPAWLFSSVTTLRYLVEDAWSLNLAYESLQGQSRNGAFLLFPGFGGIGLAEGYVRSARLSFGLTYRPLGRFAAPGLGLSDHLSTPTL